MGRAIYNRGKALEDRLRYLHGQYEEAGLAVIHQNELTGRYVGKTFRPLHRAMPDYTGFIAPHGRGVMFDAKRTQGTVYRHPTDRRHQLMTLHRFAAMGVISFLLVVSGEPEKEAGFLLWPQDEWAQQLPYSVDLSKIEDNYFSKIGCRCPAWPGAAAGNEYIPNWLNLLKIIARLGEFYDGSQIQWP
jgi:hypothetical protein